MRKNALAWAGLLLVSGLVLAACAADQPPEGGVHVAVANGEVNAVMQSYLDRAIGRAEGSRARVLVIELDTPGGLDSAMRAIVKRIERANVPIAVYVSPSGGRAASAGTFIAMAANVAAMAPNTSIGAASAVNSDGSDIGGTLGRKVENDAVALIRGIADLRGRNADWAEQAVRDAVAVNQSQALDLHVVDFVANDLDGLLAQAEGRAVVLRPGVTATLSGLVGAPVVHTDMTARERFADWLSDPTLASLLIAIGFFALLIELAHPGVILPGVAGAICLALGFFGLGTLPIDTAGLVLMGVGLALFALELVAPSGVLAVGGVIALTLGAIIAFRDTPASAHPPAWLLVVLGAFVVAMVLSLAITIRRVRRINIAMGTQALIGKIAVARTALEPGGWVFIQGERWQAQLERGTAAPGDRVRIVSAEGFRLRVKKEEAPP